MKAALALNSRPNLSAPHQSVAPRSDQLVQEIVEAYLDHDKWFRVEVQKGLAQLDNGESVSHDEVVARIERIFEP